MAQPAPHRGIPALVRRLRSGSPAQKTTAAVALFGMLSEGGPERAEEVAGPMAAAGAIQALLQIISTSRDSDLLGVVADVLTGLAFRSPARAAAVFAAGGVAPLVRLMHSDDVNAHSVVRQRRSGQRG